MKLQGDARLIALARSGNTSAFETIVDRYQPRLLGFCRQMLGSTEDAEDVLQEVFVNAYKAMLADEREINLRPWLYRIARNRCLNHLRKPTADAQESMDMVPVVEAASTAEKVSNREEFRQLLNDVGKLPETQRTALLLREMDALSYEEIAAAMETSVPSVKSLLVRARISLAEASQARQLTCGEVRLELAEAAEGLRKVSGPVRRHVRDCDECADFRAQVRTNEKAMAALFPAGPLLALKGFLISKLGLGGAGGSATGGAGTAATASGAGAGATAAATGAGAVGSVGAAIGGGGAAGGIGAVSAIGSKAVAGVVTAAVITAGAVEVNSKVNPTPSAKRAEAPAYASRSTVRPTVVTPLIGVPAEAVAAAEPVPEPTPRPAPPAPEPEATHTVATTGSAEHPVAVETLDEAPLSEEAAVKPAKAPTGAAGAPTGAETVVVTVGGATPPPAEEAVPPLDPAPPVTPPPAETPVDDPPPATGSDTSSGSGSAGADEAATADTDEA